jgi:hypothetical protein
LLAVPAAAASGLWTAELAPLVTLLALGAEPEPEPVPECDRVAEPDDPPADPVP